MVRNPPPHPTALFEPEKLARLLLAKVTLAETR
jgi:hypothetical protein